MALCLLYGLTVPSVHGYWKKPNHFPKVLLPNTHHVRGREGFNIWWGQGEDTQTFSPSQSSVYPYWVFPSLQVSLKQSLRWRAFCFSLILKASNPHTNTFSPPLNGFYFFTSESDKLNAILSACISTQVSSDVSDLISGSIFRLFPLAQKRIQVYWLSSFRRNLTKCYSNIIYLHNFQTRIILLLDLMALTCIYKELFCKLSFNCDISFKCDPIFVNPCNRSSSIVSFKLHKRDDSHSSNEIDSEEVK